MFFPRLTPRFDVALVDVRSAKAEFRVEAARSLGRAESDADRALARDALLPLLGDAVGTVRAAAIDSLGYVGDDTSLGALARRMREPTAELRQAAVVALARIGTADAKAMLRDLVGANEPDVRFQAIDVLGTLGDGPASESIASRLEDSDASVREAAIAAIVELGADSHRERIAQRLTDSEASVRAEAALALARLSDERAVPELRVLLVRRTLSSELFDAVITIGAAEFAPELRAIAARRFDSRNSALAGAALATIGDAFGMALLRRRLGSFFVTPRFETLALIARYRIVALADDVAALARNPRGLPEDVLAHTLERLDTTAAARDALAFLDGHIA